MSKLDRRRVRGVLQSTAVVALFAPTLVFAQEAPQTESASSGAGTGEIVVTAQKRQQSINSVGMTISAATGDDLAARGVKSTSDLAKIVPGLTAQPSPYGTPVYTIRGVGLYDSGIGAAPAIATYIDEVSLPSPLMTVGASLDLERVEVLKGPQGTLFGDSATGGAINYIAAKPTDSLAAGASISYERFGLIDASGYVSGPLSSTVKARLSLRAVEGGAWQYSTTRPNDRLGDSRQLFGRLLVDWEASDKLKLRLTAHGYRDRSDTQAPQFEENSLNVSAAANPANPYAIVDPARYAFITTPGSPGYDSSFAGRQALAIARLNGAAGLVAQNVAQALMGAQSPTDARGADWSPGWPNRVNRKFGQVSLRGDYEVTDNVTATSISAYSYLNSDTYTDNDATAVEGLDFHKFGFVKYFNQEFRLTGKLPGLNWIVGANYAHMTQRENENPAFFGLTLNEVIPGVVFDSNVTPMNVRSNTYSVFGNVDYEVIKGLTVQAGGRYTDDKRKSDICTYDTSSNLGVNQTFVHLQQVFTSLGLKTTPVVPINRGDCYLLSAFPDASPSITPFKQQLNQHNFSWKVGLTYTLDNGGILYVNRSRGYKSGIFSVVSGSTTDQASPAVQERLDAWEAGFKMPLLDRRVHLNGAFFHYQYQDKQLRARIVDPIFGLLEKIVNVPKSRVWGIEGAVVVQPTKGLNFSVSGTYVKSKVTDGGAGFYNQAATFGTFEGSRLPYTPEFSAVADLQYEWEVGSNLKASVGSTVTHNSSTNATFSSTALPANAFRLDSFTLVDVRASIGAQDDSWRVGIFGRNITNEYYKTSVFNNGDQRFGYAARPVTYGVTLSTKFN